MQLRHQAAQHQSILQSPVPFVFFPHIHGTNQYCYTLIQLNARRKCSREASPARRMISQTSVNSSAPHSEFILFFIMWSSLAPLCHPHPLLSFSTTRWIWRIRRQKRFTLRCWSLRRRSPSRCSIGQLSSACSKMSQEMAFILGTCINIHMHTDHCWVLMCYNSVKGPH